MLNGEELSRATGLHLDQIDFKTKDFSGIPGMGRFLLMGADGVFREATTPQEVTEYRIGGEWYQVVEDNPELDPEYDPEEEDEDEGDLILWL
jgi:hypothetical protein